MTKGAELRTSMLTQTPGGNTMPKNVKVGWSLSPGPFRETHGPLYDFIANPFGRGAWHAEGFLQTGRDLGLAWIPSTSAPRFWHPMPPTTRSSQHLRTALSVGGAH